MKAPIAVEDSGPANQTLTNATNRMSSDTVTRDSPNTPAGHMAALTAAGAAMGEAFQASYVTPGAAASEAQPTTVDRQSGGSDRLAVGNIYGRPTVLRMQSEISNASSIPPTPPPKDATPASHDDVDALASDVPPPVPSKTTGQTPTADESISHPSGPQHRPTSSGGNRLDMTAIDKFRHGFDPSTSADDTAEEAFIHRQMSANRESNLIPAEYGDYWDESKPETGANGGTRGQTVPRPETIEETASPVATVSQTQPTLLAHRFSWEKTPEPTRLSNTATGEPSTTDAGVAAAAAVAGSATSVGVEERYKRNSGVGASVESASEQATLVDRNSKEASKEASEQTGPTSTGLHVVNLRGAEEAVDLPPRLKTPEPDIKDDDSIQNSMLERDVSPAKSGNLEERTPEPVEDTSQPARPIGVTIPAGSGSNNTPISPFRELAAIPSPAERIKAYNTTRDRFATTDTGLQGWLAQTINQHPEHRHLLSGGQAFPDLARTTTGGVTRPPHKANASVSKLQTIISNATGQPAQGQSSQVEGASTARQDRTVSGQKGKEVLQNAGVLGAKVGQGAKGLFAKGRSKFRASTGSDKVE